MQFHNALAVAAVLAATVSASPVDNEKGELAPRTLKKLACLGGQKWNGWTKSCACAKSLSYNKKSAKCQYNAFDKPKCKYGEQAYCAAGLNSWCTYDTNKAQCLNDGQTKAFCAAGSAAVPGALKAWYPTTGAPPTCAGGQVYDATAQKCVCAPGQQWLAADDDGRCGYAAQARPACAAGQRAYCARDAADWCAYDAADAACQDDGYTVAFCAAPGQAQAWCDKKWSPAAAAGY